MRRRKLHILIVLGALAALGSTNYVAVYNEAYALLQAGKHSEARSKFRIVADGPPETGLQDNSEYWIGHSFLRDGNYAEAVKHYRRAQLLPNGSKHADAQFEIGRALTFAGDSVGAVIEYYKVLSLYPDANLTARAIVRIDSLGDPSKNVAVARKRAAPEPPKPPATQARPAEAVPPAPDTIARAETSTTPSTTPARPAPRPTQEIAGTPSEPQPAETPPDETPAPRDVVDVTTPSEESPAVPTPIPQPPPRPTGSPPVEGASPEPTAQAVPRQQVVEEDGEVVEGDSLWDQPDPTEGEDGIKKLPLWTDPRALITPGDKRGF
ncbi:MAG TPA: tetratricopeptide repeat protein [candidate division Zixibacteria bacterium]|nr:tetratricopeptide repeat protein [candidate division Zixibacteria bacterium]